MLRYNLTKQVSELQKNYLQKWRIQGASELAATVFRVGFGTVFITE